MNARFQKNTGILLLLILVLLNARCQKKDDSENFTAADVYGKWNCYKINTLWKSVPDSVTNSPVDSMSNFYRITEDSVINYVKIDSVPCYTKSSVAVSYSTNPSDSVSLDSTLIIQASQTSDGIILKYFYTKTDSIREYYLRKIETTSTINVCDYGNTLFKRTATGTNIVETVSVVVRGMRQTSQNSCSWF